MTRNATRDYVDFVTLADRLGNAQLTTAMHPFDQLYPQDNGQSPLQQLTSQLANALPYDLQQTDLSIYKNLALRWHDWHTVKTACAHIATAMFDGICDIESN